MRLPLDECVLARFGTALASLQVRAFAEEGRLSGAAQIPPRAEPVDALSSTFRRKRFSPSATARRFSAVRAELVEAHWDVYQ